MNNKEFTEPEEIISEDANWSPLDEPVNEKPYTQPNVKLDEKDINSRISEPSLQPPPIDLTTPPPKQENKKEEPFNPEMQNMSKKDQGMASERVAEMILSGYEWVNELADNALQFSERKMQKLHREGEINLNSPVQYGPDQFMPTAEFIQEHNVQMKGTITVTPEFKEEVKPILTDVLQEEGIGMTKKQQLIWLFGKDIAVKSFLVIQSVKQKKDLINYLKEMNGASPKTSQQYTPPPPPTHTEPSIPVVEPEEDIEIPIDEEISPADPQQFDVNSFVNDMTGGNQAPAKEYVQPNVTGARVKKTTSTKKTTSGKRGRTSNKK